MASPTTTYAGKTYKAQFSNQDFRGLSLLASPSTKSGEVVVHQQLEDLRTELSAIQPGLTQSQVETLIQQNIVGLFELRKKVDASAVDVATAIAETPQPGFAYLVETAGTAFGFQADAGDVVYYLADGSWGKFDNVDPSVSTEASDPILTVQKVAPNEYQVTAKAAFIQRIADLESAVLQAQTDIDQLEQGLIDEQTTRQSAITSLQGQVSAANTAIADLSVDLAEESTRRAADDTLLAGRIDAAVADIANLNVQTATERDVRAAAVISLQSDISNESLRAQDAEENLSLAIQEGLLRLLQATKKRMVLFAVNNAVIETIGGNTITVYYAEGFANKSDFEVIGLRTPNAPFELYSNDIDIDLIPAAEVPAAIRGNSTNYFARISFVASSEINEVRVTMERYPNQDDMIAIATGTMSGQ